MRYEGPTERHSLKPHHFLGSLAGAGVGYLATKSAEGAVTGAAVGTACAIALERLVRAVGHKVLYDFVNK